MSEWWKWGRSSETVEDDSAKVQGQIEAYLRLTHKEATVEDVDTIVSILRESLDATPMVSMLACLCIFKALIKNNEDEERNSSEVLMSITSDHVCALLLKKHESHLRKVI